MVVIGNSILFFDYSKMGSKKKIKAILKIVLGPVYMPLWKVFFCCKMYIIDFKMKKDGYIVQLQGIHSLFYLPFVKTDEIQYDIYFSKDYYVRKSLDYIANEWHDGMISEVVKSKAILDIGSNIGNHTLYFLNECGAKYVYCFEPAIDTFTILRKNIEINHLENKTTLFNVGVGRKSGDAVIASSKDRNTAYTKIAVSEKGDIKIVSIDELEIAESIGFVKIDVEGFELEVIKGMQKTLKRDKPVVLIEIWDENLDEINKIMLSQGYKVHVLEKRRTQGDYIFYN